MALTSKRRAARRSGGVADIRKGQNHLFDKDEKMKSIRMVCTVIAVLAVCPPCAQADTNAWGQTFYTHYQSSSIHGGRASATAVRKRLGPNETVKADFKRGEWIAVFKPSEDVRSITNALGYMEVQDLFPAPLPAGTIEGGVGSAPPVKTTVESMKTIAPRRQRSQTSFTQTYQDMNSPKIPQGTPSRERSAQSTHSERTPNVLSVLSVLCKDQGLLDTGQYSRDQQELIFERQYKGKTYVVSGEVSDIAETLWAEKKYVAIKVTSGHYFNVFPSKDFDLLEYKKGSRVSFAGIWTTFGTGIMIHHRIENAVQQ